MLIGFFLGIFFMFILANIIGFIKNKYKKEQTKEQVKQIEKYIEDTIIKNLKNQIGFKKPINIVYDRQQDIIQMSKKDWGIITEALMRLSNIKKIECMPINDFFIQDEEIKRKFNIKDERNRY